MLRIATVLLAFAVSLMPAAFWPATAQTDDASYRLVPSDLIDIRVVGVPDLDAQVRVGEDGQIAYPYVGRIDVVGLTMTELETQIETALRDGGIIRNPDVIASVSGFGTVVSVLGAVRAPGSFALDRRTTVTQLLARAGGLAPEASSAATLRRTGPDGSLEVIPVDLDALLNRADESQNIVIRNNDEFYVPEAPTYYLYGNVNTPGAHLMRWPMTVQEALANGGGISSLGSERRVTIRRATGNGSVEEIDAEMADMVLPLDIIDVGERIF